MALVYDDIYRICEDKEKMFNWLKDKKLLGDYQNATCEKCYFGKLRLQTDKSFSQDGIYWRCNNSSCRKKISIRKNSWFEKSHMSLESILKLTYYWVYKYPEELLMHELKIGSDHTAVDWYNFAREVCVEVLERNSEQIGGPGEIVEIDESKFGKRKYHRGKRVDGVWVFGGIDRRTKRCFLQTVTNRSAETLIPIIIANIKPGTTIMSDCWKAYSKIKEEGYLHSTVNHSIEFKSSEGACTNTIESTWNAVKKSLPKFGTRKDMYDTYFAEYCIRKQYLKPSSDRFLKFLELITEVHPVKERKPLANVQPCSNFNNSLDDFVL